MIHKFITVVWVLWVKCRKDKEDTKDKKFSQCFNCIYWNLLNLTRVQSWMMEWALFFSWSTVTCQDQNQPFSPNLQSDLHPPMKKWWWRISSFCNLHSHFGKVARLSQCHCVLHICFSKPTQFPLERPHLSWSMFTQSKSQQFSYG